MFFRHQISTITIDHWLEIAFILNFSIENKSTEQDHTNFK